MLGTGLHFHAGRVMADASIHAALLVLVTEFSENLRPQAFNDSLNVDDEFCEHNALLQSRDHRR